MVSIRERETVVHAATTNGPYDMDCLRGLDVSKNPGIGVGLMRSEACVPRERPWLPMWR
jgi:hypothetical protein